VDAELRLDPRDVALDLGRIQQVRTNESKLLGDVGHPHQIAVLTQ
jgi:hypothetical protein